jgi:hypothetical protein
LVRPLILIVVLAVVLVVVLTLPASLIKRLLPPSVIVDDLSGTLWHGSAGTLVINTRNAGAIEWRLHPASLLALTLSADLHWVKISFVADGTADIDRHGLIAHGVQGGGPLDNLAEFGLAPGWHGTTTFKFSEIALHFDDDGARLRSAMGDVTVADLAAPQIAGGTNLGGYALHVASGTTGGDADLVAELTDTGGPLELHATVRYSPRDGNGLLSGTIKERLEAPPALRAELDNLAQLHARDADGRLPVDLEFKL